MPSDTFESIWNEVHGHSMAVDPLLVQSWVRDAWREIAESRTWSWLRRRYVQHVAAPYTDGTVTCTPGDTAITFTGSILTDGMAGRQFRIGNGPIYDIVSVDVTTDTAQIWPPWIGDSIVVDQPFKIFTAYLCPPDSDFFAWIAVTNPALRRRLRLHVNQEEIDYHDAGRLKTSLGPACISGLDWARSYEGKVYSTLQVHGSGPVPIASGTYTGQTDSVFIITMTVTAGVKTFSWRKDNGPLHSDVTILPEGHILPEGVGVYVPATAVTGDIFVIRVSTRPQYGSPRYEIYPHPTAALTLNTTYATRVRDIDEPGFVLPYTMRGDVIKLGALARMARYPGTDQRPNPFSQIARAQYMEDKFQIALAELNTADDYIMETNVSGPSDSWELSLLPWMSSSGTGMRATADYDPRDFLI
jgi:hypothetical protein